MQTIQSFVEKYKIRLVAEWEDENPYMPDSARSMDNWKCVLRTGNRRMTVHFSKGFGHGGKEPEAREILSCVALDSSGYDNARDFEDWCSNYDYDTDSRKAEKTWKQIERQAKSLRKFLGDEGYDELLHETETD